MLKPILPSLPRSTMFINEVMVPEWQNFFRDLVESMKGYLRKRLDLDYVTQIAWGKPTLISRGIHKGFSFPIYSTDNEELFGNASIPRRWDGVSNFEVVFLVSTSGIEDVGDKFKFQFSWDRIYCGKVIVDTVVDVEVETTIAIGNSAAWSTYFVIFTIDYDIADHSISESNLLSGRLRRIAASALEVTNEIVVWSAFVNFKVDKIFVNTKCH